ncbi:homoserine O-acetyltransferase MetX [Elongatibacter sediminis]|uniref:Serine O-succinyltransferase n=1 Tax=Elongatibacter sediminis TaxID=3119006 RepID=A0AAW9R7M1_9GAMM
MNSATQYLNITEPFSFRRGGSIPELTLAYETWGSLDANKSNAVMILTGISPSAHATSSAQDPSEGWWEPMVGSGRPIDTDRNFVVCINSLGSCKGSTGPDSTNPATGKPYRLEFPEVTIWDIARAAQLVLDHLGITQLRMMVGPSMGGMSGLAWLHQFPHGARHFLGISSSANAEPFSIAIRSLQREAIVSDPDWQNGNYSPERWPRTGMRLARKLGMITYRSAREWRERFGRLPQDRYEPTTFGMNFAVESYLENAAAKFVSNYDPCTYVYLSRAMDWFDATEGHADLTDALSHIALESACLIGVDSDILFPVHQQRDLADAFHANGVRSNLVTLPSDQGHDAFLVDYDRFRPAVAGYFAQVLDGET